MPGSAPFLISVDLEDVRSMIPGGLRLPERVPVNTRRCLDLFERHGARCTFFTTGDVARRHPDLVREVAARGHEVACHGDAHVPVDRLGRDGLRRDLERALESLARAGVSNVSGFRAPYASLTPRTRFAWEVLRETGFRYSSSVVPVHGALHGWPGFARRAVRTEAGPWEIPVSVLSFGSVGLPFASGVYLRVLPFAPVRRAFRRSLRRGDPVVAYVHPQDLDTDEERRMYPGIGGSRLLNALMYAGRSRLPGRLSRLLSEAGTLPYVEYVERHLEPASEPAEAPAAHG